MCWAQPRRGEVKKRSLRDEMVSLNSGHGVGDGCGLLEAWLDPGCGALEPMPSKQLVASTHSHPATTRQKK